MPLSLKIVEVQLFSALGMRRNESSQSEKPMMGRRGTTKSAAERMRLYRRRRQQGVQYIRLPLHVTDIDGLIRVRYLTQNQRQDQEAIERAILFLLHDTCDFLE